MVHVVCRLACRIWKIDARLVACASVSVFAPATSAVQHVGKKVEQPGFFPIPASGGAGGGGAGAGALPGNASPNQNGGKRRRSIRKRKASKKTRRQKHRN